MDKIHFTGMRFHGYHGCLDFEQKDGQTFIIDLTLGLDLRAAGQSDDLDDTVNYAEVFSVVQRIVVQQRFNLIEALAERIASQVLADFSTVLEISVRVNKPNAPIEGTFDNVAVEITRLRN